MGIDLERDLFVNGPIKFWRTFRSAFSRSLFAFTCSACASSSLSIARCDSAACLSSNSFATRSVSCHSLVKSSKSFACSFSKARFSSSTFFTCISALRRATRAMSSRVCAELVGSFAILPPNISQCHTTKWCLVKTTPVVFDTLRRDRMYCIRSGANYTSYKYSPDMSFAAVFLGIHS